MGGGGGSTCLISCCARVVSVNYAVLLAGLSGLGNYQVHLHIKSKLEKDCDS